MMKITERERLKMTRIKKEKSVREPLFHIVKRDRMPWWKGLVVRVAAVLGALALCMLISYVFVGVTPDRLIKAFFQGNFGSEMYIWWLGKELSILLCIALALTPAFLMRFWNIGAEGQTIIGALVAVFCAYELGGKIPEPLLLLIMFLASVAAGALWGFIPALFKAVWNSNETLFTLMMNYIAIQLVRCMLAVWDPTQSNPAPSAYGKLNLIPSWSFGDELTVILIAVALTVGMYVYLRYSKHGYEISVVGESENTARYIGINVKKVTLRTMIISGALCGLVGFLIIAVFDHRVSPNTVGGQGFTAIMVSWLAKFNPIIMVGTSFLIAFLNRGANQLVTNLSNTRLESFLNKGASNGDVVKGISSDFPSVIVGIILFAIVGCEFFINYRVKFRKRNKTKGGRMR